MDKFYTIKPNSYTFLPALIKWILRTLKIFNSIKLKSIESNNQVPYRDGRYKIHCDFHKGNSVTIFVDMKTKKMTVFSVDYQMNITTDKTRKFDDIIMVLHDRNKDWKSSPLIDSTNPIKLSKIVRS